MGKSDLFALKYRLRKTDESVEIVAWETAEKGARNENDWVSYIDSNGNEHIKEHLTLEWDFVAEDPFSGGILGGLTESIVKMDPWEARRYELAKEFLLHGLADSAKGSVAMADFLLEELKTKDEGAVVEGVQMDGGYENIGIGEIVESIDGPERLKKFVFTDKKDIVGYRGDSGRWAVGDRVKVYIKRLEPQEEERPVP
jgi:hypothetical protein